jgi:hypothetical protein
MASKNLTTTGTSTYATTYGGAVYLTFGDSQIMLTAANLKIPRFSYVSESFYTAVSLGQIKDALTQILNKFSDETGISVDTVTTQIDSLSNLPVLGQILKSELVITEFVIQPPSSDTAKDGRYSFGIGLKLTEGNTLGPITLDGVSFNIALTQTA